MAVIERPPAEPAVAEPTPTAVPLLRRPQATEGFWGWMTTIDHKKIGILYGASALIYFILGGLEALLIRVQLAQPAAPNETLFSAEFYNQLFTMHGTTMIFLVVMPLSAAFFNYLAPIMIGARDVAFPRLNAFSYWMFLVGGLVLYSSFLLGGAPNGGWFAYTPNTSITFSPGHNMDFWIWGLLITGIASTVGAVNLTVTVLNLRAPGMTLMRMPVFVWMTLIVQLLLIFSLPIITIDIFLLMFDRSFGANFFNPAEGGDPLLWQHLFWLFGHPEVYILILPAMGIVSEVLPVFSRKPLFGYAVVVFSGIAIAFMGFGVWAHHMFAVGLGPVAVSAFSVSTMFIAVPTGVKIFNWLGTMWGGSLRFRTAMLFAVGFIAMFTIGGLSGVTHSLSPHDRQQTDTYYIVAHFHYVLFGGAMFGLMAGFYYWWPKAFGKMLNERLGRWHFWTWLIGFNLTFGPMHWIGLQGMPRRIYRFDDDLNLGELNMLATVGAFVIALSVCIFVYNIFYSHRHSPPAVADPWDGRTLEWSVPSPTPVYNFAEIPVVHSLDDYWHRKYTEDEDGRLVALHPKETAPAIATLDDAGSEDETLPEGETVPAAEDEHAEHGEHEGHHIHLPSPSFYPLVASVGFFPIAYGMIYEVYVVTALGILVTLAALYAWALEPSTEPEPPGPVAGGEEAAIEEELAAEDAALTAGSPEVAVESTASADAVPDEEGE